MPDETVPTQPNEHACSGTGVEPLPSQLRSLQTRFLCPFFFAAGRVAEAAQAMRQANVAGRPASWEAAEPTELYLDELQQHAVQFLFPNPVGAGTSHYLKLTHGTLNTLFHQLQVQWPKGTPIRTSPVWGPGVELFLTAFGVGVLSISLTPRDEIDLTRALEFNYRLAQFRRRDLAELRIPHPSENTEAWERIPEANRRRIAPAPPPESPVADRLGVAGGSYTFQELFDELLRPLLPFGLDLVQSQLSVFTVAQFDASVDLDSAEVRRRMLPAVSALAQVLEPLHAGIPTDFPLVPHEILNRRHWTAAALCGTAHLMADQPAPEGFEEHPFNAQRVPRTRDKYFIAYLLAMLQRLFLYRQVADAGRIAQGSAERAAREYARVRIELLRFSVAGHFTQVSNRHAVHRFYQLAREALDVPAAWAEARHALADLDAGYAAERGQRVATNVRDNLAIVARTQSMIEWIEIFLVSVYGAHLWEIVVANLTHHKGPLLVGWGALACALLGGGITAAVLKPWKHRVHQDEPDGHDKKAIPS